MRFSSYKYICFWFIRCQFNISINLFISVWMKFWYSKRIHIVVGLALWCTSFIISGRVILTSRSLPTFSPETFLPRKISSILLATFLCTDTVFLSTISTTMENVGSCFLSSIVFCVFLFLLQCLRVTVCIPPTKSTM